MMRRIALAMGVVAAAAAAGCVGASQSSNPLSPSIAGPIAGVSITAPAAVKPSAGSRIPVDQQPITLAVTNATTNGPRPLTYLFEVATDSAFANKVFTKDGITPGDGQTALQLASSLGTGKTYFWHARAQDGANTGPFTSPVSFDVYTPVVFQAPAPVSPINNTTTTTLRPTFTFTNASRTGPAGAVGYLVEIADNANFGSPLLTLTTSEQANQTAVAATADLPAGKPLFWHVRAFDPTTNGPFSGAATFQVSAGSGGGGGGGGGGCGGGCGVIQSPNDGLNVASVTFVDNPPDEGGFAVTAKITFIQFRADALIVDFDKRTGGGAWGNLPFSPTDPVDGGGIQYTLGLCFNRGGWYCSAAIQFWQGRELEAGAAPTSIPDTWYYDGRWSPMNGYLPANGENVGVFVIHGNVRGVHDSSQLRARERSNIAVVPFDRGGGSSFSLSSLFRPFGR